MECKDGLLVWICLQVNATIWKSGTLDILTAVFIDNLVDDSFVVNVGLLLDPFLGDLDTCASERAGSVTGTDVDEIDSSVSDGRGKNSG